MKILVTGAAGFLGSRLIGALLSGREGLPPVSAIVAADMAACPILDARVDCRTGSITDAGFLRSIVGDDVDVVYHLAAVLSGQAEAEFDLGMRVNVDATRSLLEACRRLTKTPRVVFTSTVAVFGGSLPPVVPENMVLSPETSYGTEKAMTELLVNDYSRKGFIDGIVCRLATIAIRPGAPNSAMSSFVSGIIREPLAGIESVCPVPLDTRLWISSPGTVTSNLLQAAVLPAAAFGGRRNLNLPGLCVTPGEMLDSLERHGGANARALVRCEPDERTMRIVCGWPGALDVSRPLGLGFTADRHIDDVVRQFMAGR
jgi:D-erythronate 2-dehydrogenase